MEQSAIAAAAAALISARSTGRLLDGLDAAHKPATVHDALAIQDATVRALGDDVAGWKVGSVLDGKLVRGVLLRSRVFASPATIPARLVPLLGVEAEIAFRFDRALPPRDRDYTYDEVAAAVTAMVAIEVVDTRYRDYRAAPLIERVADCVSNGAFVEGTIRPGWRDVDLSRLNVELIVDGVAIVAQASSHPAGDPLLPAVALVNDLRAGEGVAAGQVMTTGTCSGLNFVKPGQSVIAKFAEFGTAEVTVPA